MQVVKKIITGRAFWAWSAWGVPRRCPRVGMARALGA